MRAGASVKGLVQVEAPEVRTFVCFQRRVCQLLTKPRVLGAHDVLRLQLQHSFGVCGDGLRGLRQPVALDVHLHLGRHLHALLVHGAVIYGGRRPVLLELLSKLVSSKQSVTIHKVRRHRPYSHRLPLCTM